MTWLRRGAASCRCRYGPAFVGAVLLLAVAAAGTWRWLRGPAPAIPPPLLDIPDTEVRQAVQRARRKVLEKPNDAPTWGHLGKVLLAHRLDADADRCFAEAARLDPRSPSWPYGRALIALKHHPDAAAAFLRQALSAQRWEPKQQSAARMQLAEVYLERQELQEAEKLFQEEWRCQPGQPRAAFGLGLIALARNDARRAEELLSQARSSSLARKRATVQLAALAGRGGDAAAANYDREAAALPDDPPWPDPFREQVEQLRVGHFAWLLQEVKLEEQHRFAEAAALYLQEAQMKPTARAYARAGFNLAQAGDYEQALTYLRQSVQLDPHSAHAHILFAITLFMRAETQWKRSASSPQARQWFRTSIEEARRAAELQPTQAPAYLFWGRALQYLGEPAAAVVPLRQGVERAPQDFSLQLRLGEVLLDVGRYSQAETHLKNAQKLKPDDPRPAEALERLPRAPPQRGASGRHTRTETKTPTLFSPFSS